MNKCCVHCFDNENVKQAILKYGDQGDCNYCGSQNVTVIDISNEHFSWKIHNLLQPFAVKPEKGHPLTKWLTTQFNLFNKELHTDVVKKIIADISVGGIDVEANYVFKTGEFRSAQLWNQFKEDLKHKSRFALTFPSELREMLMEIMSINEITIDRDSLFYRCRIGTATNRSAYRNGAIMCPPKELVGNGRINAKGIPYLYTADNKSTAIAEVRPSTAVPVSVAKVKTSKPCKFLSFNTFKFDDNMAIEDQYQLYALTHWINTDLSKPVDSSSSYFDYLPTQFIAELASSKDFEGLAFNSSLADGVNYVFFIQESVEFVDSEIYLVKAIKYDVEPKEKPLSTEDFNFDILGS